MYTCIPENVYTLSLRSPATARETGASGTGTRPGSDRRSSELRQPRPSGPAALDDGVQAVPARTVRRVELHEQEEHERVHDPRADVRRRRSVRPSESLGHGPDEQAQHGACGVRELPHEPEDEGEREGELQDSGAVDEDGGLARRHTGPEREPSLEPRRLTLAGVRDHPGEGADERGIELEHGVEPPDHAERDPEGGLQDRGVPNEPSVRRLCDQSFSSGPPTNGVPINLRFVSTGSGRGLRCGDRPTLRDLRLTRTAIQPGPDSGLLLR